MNSKRAIAALMAASMVLMTGCGDSSSNSSAESADAQETSKAEETSKVEETSDEVIELRLHDVIPEPTREEWFKGVVEQWNAENPNIHVTFESTPWDNAHNKLVTQASSNTMPDITLTHFSWLPEFTEAGWLVPMDDYIADWENYDKLNAFTKNILMDYDMKQAYGANYGIPSGIMTFAMFVRTDWLEEVGMTLDDLSTWEGVFEAAYRMTDPEKNRYGWSFRGARAGAGTVLSYALGETGGKLYSEDGVCLMNTDEMKIPMEKFSNLYFDGVAPADSVNWGYTEMVQGFTSGLTGILSQTVEVVKTCEETMEEGTWTTVPFPESSDGNVYGAADSYYYAITSCCEHPDAAWEFIEYITSPEICASYCETNYYIPIYNEVSGEAFEEGGALAAFLESMSRENFVRPDTTYGYFVETAEFRETIFDAEFQKYLLGQQTLDELVDYCANYLTEGQQAYLAQPDNAGIPAAVKADGTILN